jgi:molybdopterin converting factor small subunit
MAVLRLFASIREAAGERAVSVAGDTVGEVVSAAEDKFGDHFRALVPTCRIWLNGEPATLETPVGDHDEVALLPPVSGG